jgi:hypothetical protein
MILSDNITLSENVTSHIIPSNCPIAYYPITLL